MPVETREMSGQIDLAQRLSEAGYSDVLVLKRETARDVLTEKRMELVDEIRTGEPASIRELSRSVGRDVSAVHDDLQILFKYDIIDFREDQVRKIPGIAHENVIVEPVV